jgi:hypothetical protein
VSFARAEEVRLANVMLIFVWVKRQPGSSTSLQQVSWFITDAEKTWDIKVGHFNFKISGFIPIQVFFPLEIEAWSLLNS